MKHLTLQQPVHFYCPITRIDAENRIVEGYFYTQAKVKGDKWNLKRETLERSAIKYMEMPAIRSMHRNDIAAGLGLGLAWDEKGGKVSAEIVDDQEWRKVEKGVYRGFSLGGVPVIVRGNDVEEFDLREISLVDRPADPGALFTTMVRSENGALEGGYDVLVLEGDEEAPDDVPQVLARLEQSDNGETVPDIIRSEVEEQIQEDANNGSEQREHHDAGQPDAGSTDADDGNTDADAGSTDGHAAEGQLDAGQSGEPAGGAEDGSADGEGRADTGNEGTGESTADGAERSGADAAIAARTGTEGTGESTATGVVLDSDAVRSEPSPNQSGSVRRDGAARPGSTVRNAETEPAPGTGDHSAADRTTQPSAVVGQSSDPSEPELNSGSSSDQSDVARGITSETAPTRENLEGARKAVRRVTRFAHSKGNECLHPTRDGATRCEAGVERSAVVQADLLAPTYEVPTFRDYAVAIAQQGATRGLRSACRALLQSLLSSNDETVNHQNIDEFADYMHDYVEGIEEARRENLSQPAVPVWFDDYDSPYPSPDCCISTDPLRAEMVSVNDLLRVESDAGESEEVERLERAEARASEAESELVTVRGDLNETVERAETLERSLKAAEEEVQTLRKTPLERKQPVQFTAHVERQFAANALREDADPAEVERSQQQDEYNRVKAQAEVEPDAEKRRGLVSRMISLEHLLNRR